MKYVAHITVSMHLARKRSKEKSKRFISTTAYSKKFEPYLELPQFELPIHIAKIKMLRPCIDMEKGRRRDRIDRNLRICKLCNKREIETEEHFLKSCDLYTNLKTKQEIPVRISSTDIMRDMDHIKLEK